jgi:hypothetical protein
MGAVISVSTISSGISALVLATVFPIGGRIQPFRAMVRDRDQLLSLSGGVSIAYVFVGLMPEMATARQAYAASTAFPLLFKGMIVYFVALVGFMAYSGLEILRRRMQSKSRSRENLASYYIHIGGISVYVWMIAFILVSRVEKTSLHIVIYTFAMAAHFLTIDHSLREEHGLPFERSGRYLLAAVCALGWVAGVILPVPLYAVALMAAFVSGAIVMNNSIMELSHRNEERFLAFLFGGVVYGLLLLPLG